MSILHGHRAFRIVRQGGVSRCFTERRLRIATFDDSRRTSAHLSKWAARYLERVDIFQRARSPQFVLPLSEFREGPPLRRQFALAPKFRSPISGGPGIALIGKSTLASALADVTK